ncbi:MAG TPA: polymer-forming cytoskeletal protein [Bacteroidales bacterium]|nr:polymer-forming cytoskeletal protein [Bacteroidales bacterium]
MAKFSEKRDKDNNTVGNGIINIVASGTKIVGKVTVESDFRLDGEIEGDIFGKNKVVIGEKGYLKGTLTCANAEILGKVTGDINATNSLTLRSTAELNGNVEAKSLVIEMDAVFNGVCTMRKNVQKDSETEQQQKSE